MVDDGPPPLPVKQRSKSVLAEQNSVPHGDGGYGTVSSPQRHTVQYGTVLSSQRHTVQYGTVPSSQRHTEGLPSSAEFVSSLDNILAELSEAAAPKKPPRGARLSSYDNVTPTCDSVAANGNCFSFPSSSGTRSSSATTCRSSSDELSNSFMSPDHAGNSDGLPAEYFMSRSREASHVNNSAMSQTSYRVTSMTAGSVPATTAAPPLPMKLKHSQSTLHFAFVFA